MHRLGMLGRDYPCCSGFGCNVPAIMSIRLLHSRRERIIASFLVTMIPCSARTVIIAGIVASFIGILAALSIYLAVFALIIITGIFLSRITPGEQFGMIMEMAPLRLPTAHNVMMKSWNRIKEFLFIAMPLLIVASIILGFLQYAGVFEAFQNMIEPFSPWCWLAVICDDGPHIRLPGKRWHSRHSLFFRDCQPWLGAYRGSALHFATCKCIV